jgi:Bacterial regulatory proteins, luxR family
MSLATTDDLAEPLDRVSRPLVGSPCLELTHPTNREVAERLFVSPHAVNSHLRHVFAKLGIDSRVELADLRAITSWRDHVMPRAAAS